RVANHITTIPYSSCQALGLITIKFIVTRLEKRQWKVTVNAHSTTQKVYLVNAKVNENQAVNEEAPFYQALNNEEEVFEKAWQHGMPVHIKGPTGCGKTRFVQHMAHRLNKTCFPASRGAFYEYRHAMLPCFFKHFLFIIQRLIKRSLFVYSLVFIHFSIH